jgi:hypothetical protein
MNTLTKAIASLTLCLVSVLAHAGSWSYIDESNESDTRLIGKLDDIEVAGTTAADRVATAPFQFVTDGVYSGTIMAAIIVKDCAKSGGHTAMIDVASGKGRSFYWVKGGSRFYDSVGTAMCISLARRGIVR